MFLGHPRILTIIPDNAQVKPTLLKCEHGDMVTFEGDIANSCRFVLNPLPACPLPKLDYFHSFVLGFHWISPHRCSNSKSLPRECCQTFIPKAIPYRPNGMGEQVDVVPASDSGVIVSAVIAFQLNVPVSFYDGRLRLLSVVENTHQGISSHWLLLKGAKLVIEGVQVGKGLFHGRGMVSVMTREGFSKSNCRVKFDNHQVPMHCIDDGQFYNINLPIVIPNEWISAGTRLSLCASSWTEDPRIEEIARQARLIHTPYLYRNLSAWVSQDSRQFVYHIPENKVFRSGSIVLASSPSSLQVRFCY